MCTFGLSSNTEEPRDGKTIDPQRILNEQKLFRDCAIERKKIKENLLPKCAEMCLSPSINYWSQHPRSTFTLSSLEMNQMCNEEAQSRDTVKWFRAACTYSLMGLVGWRDAERSASLTFLCLIFPFVPQRVWLSGLSVSYSSRAEYDACQ